MDRPVRVKFNTQIHEEACEWFIECRAGELDPVARAEFDRWLRKSPEHQAAYLEIAAIWNEGPTLDQARRWDLEGLIAQAAEDTGNVVSIERTPRPNGNTPQPVSNRAEIPERVGPVSAVRPAASESHPRPARLLAIAASILLMTAAIVAYMLAPTGVYATTLGEQRSLALNDGSTVQLNSLSKIRVRYSEHERIVDLVEGQALFHVAKDTSRPFIVNSGQTRVRAVGTQFDVYRKADGTVVTVVEGRVAVLGTLQAANSSAFTPGRDWESARQPVLRDENVPAGATNAGHSAALNHQGEQSQPTPPGINADTLLNPAPGTAVPEGAIFLAAGEQITVTAQAAHKSVHPNVAGATAWTQRELVFESAPLTDVAGEFNRYNERKLVIDSSAVGSFHISGVFSSTDPASLIRFLRDRPGLRVIETPTQIRVEKDR